MLIVKTRFALFFGLVAALLAGCGGNSTNSSPLAGGTVADQNRSGKPAVGAANTANGVNWLPVYLTVKPESITDDVWIKVREVTLQTNSAEVSVGSFASGLGLRLAALRDVDGRRFLFLGMADMANHVVRAKVTLDDAFTVEKLGEKPDVRHFAADATTSSGGRVDARLNLDPNAQFQDALVLELNLTKGSKEGELVPQIALGSAADVSDPTRQEHSLLTGKFVKSNGERWIVKTANGEVTLVPSEDVLKDARKSPAEGANIACAIGYVPTSKLAIVTQWTAMPEKQTLALGKLVAVQDSQKLAIFDITQSTDGTASTLSLAMGSQSVAADGVGKGGLITYQSVEGSLTLSSLLSETELKVAQTAKAADSKAEKATEKAETAESKKPDEKPADKK